jgi:parkin
MAARDDEFLLTVRGPDNRPLHVSVTPQTKVSEVKRKLRQKSQYIDQMDIVFNGDFLQDEKRLKDLGIMTTSTLHWVKGAKRVTTGKVAQAMTEIDLVSLPPAARKGLSSSPVPSDDDSHQFYVYCKDPCENISPGKLRVRCADCREAKFVLDKDPSGWDDILTKRKLTGECHHGNCQGKHAEFYFKCANHDTAQDQTSPALPMFRRNNYNIECPVCYVVQPLVVVFDCPDLHVVCYNCFLEYCKTALENRTFVKDREGWHTLPCPCSDHKDYVVKDIHHFRILGKKDYLRYKEFATIQMLLEMGGVICPKPGCGEGLLPEHTNRRIECSSCRHVFCRECKEKYHQGKCSSKAPSEAPRSGKAMEIDTRAFREARWREANQTYLKEKTKPCPHCRADTEKNGGCNHITCTVCKHEWCWMCLNKWGRGCMDDHWFA